MDSILQGGRVLAPLPRERPVQLIDGRDLAAFMLHLVEGDIAGTYNALGPDEPLTWGRMLDDIVEVSPTPNWCGWSRTSSSPRASSYELPEGGESPLYHQMSWERGRAAGPKPRPHGGHRRRHARMGSEPHRPEMLMTLQRESVVLASTAP